MPACRSRLSLGDLLLYIALAAITLSQTKLVWPEQIYYLIVDFLGLAFLVAYRRLSPWIWAAIASYVSVPLFDLVDRSISSIRWPPAEFPAPGRFARALMIWAGIGMSLRAAHRRLVDLEALLASRPAGDAPTGEPIASDLPA